MRRRDCSDKSSGTQEEGIIALDALVALSLVSLLLALVLNTAVTGLKAGRMASERTLALSEAEYRLASSLPSKATDSGVSAGTGYQWAVERRSHGSEVAPRLCALSSKVKPPTSRRTYTLETVRFCAT